MVVSDACRGLGLTLGNRPRDEPGFRVERTTSDANPARKRYQRETVSEDEPPRVEAQQGAISDYLQRTERERDELRSEQREQLSREGGALDPSDAFNASHIGEVLARLDRELIGLLPVKARIREIAHSLLVTSMRGRVGLAAERPQLHMSFTGRPGTGKTTVALRMAEILYRLGYVRRGHLVSATRADLVGDYIGHTAPKIKEVLLRAMGGVLFIDDANDLHKPENERDYGREAIEILFGIMETNREDLVLIFSGNRDRVDTLFQSNPGLASRVAHHIDFPDYSPDELIAIAHVILERLNYEFSPAAEAAFHEYLLLRLKQPQFANARSIGNAIDRARLRQATRLFEKGGNVKAHDLRLIDEPDIRKSRAFQQQTP